MQKPEEHTEKRTYYILKCPKCQKEIKGMQPAQTQHNLRVHMMIHEDNDECDK